jgi:hypothetical protein
MNSEQMTTSGYILFVTAIAIAFFISMQAVYGQEVSNNRTQLTPEPKEPLNLTEYATNMTDIERLTNQIAVCTVHHDDRLVIIKLVGVCLYPNDVIIHYSDLGYEIKTSVGESAIYMQKKVVK